MSQNTDLGARNYTRRTKESLQPAKTSSLFRNRVVANDLSKKEPQCQSLTAVLPGGITLNVRISLDSNPSISSFQRRYENLRSQGIQQLASKKTDQSIVTRSSNKSDLFAPDDIVELENDNFSHKKRKRESRSLQNKVSGDTHPNDQKGTNGYTHTIGADHNNFYCHVCKDAGYVVCCDRCPNVFHAECIPKGCESRKSLEADEDPWFCPECYEFIRQIKTDAVRPVEETIKTGDSTGQDQDTHISQSPSQRYFVESDIVNQHDCLPSMVKEQTESTVDCSDVQQNTFDHDNDAFINLHASSEPSKPITTLKPISPFHIYLIDNRTKIETHLTKRNQEFKRVRKGFDRNILVAKEGAKRWFNSSLLERKKYIDISMQDFSDRIITWKENKTIREMIGLDATQAVYGGGDENYISKQRDCFDELHNAHHIRTNCLKEDANFANKTKILDDASSKLRCKVLDYVPKICDNKILIELLRDQRFHHTHLIHPNRSSMIDESYTNKSVSDSPYISIQGPTSTFIGDTCIGCLRGWSHFCPIVHRHLPAVELRGKLQPPLSTLMATRLGYGLSTMTPNKIQQNEEDLKMSIEPKGSLAPPRSLLEQARSQCDIVVTFLEEAISVKQKQYSDRISDSKIDARLTNYCTLPTKKSDDRYSLVSDVDKTNEKVSKMYVCSNCQVTNESEYGCPSCRREKLLAEMSKRLHLSRRESAIATHKDWGRMSTPISDVQTQMLCRSDLRFSKFDKQEPGEVHFALATLKRLWKPNAILPRSSKTLPRRDSLVVGFASNPASGEANHDNKSDTIMNFSIHKGQVVRVRSTSSRSKISTDTSELNSHAVFLPDHFQALAVENRKEGNELQRICVATAICGILQALMRLDPLGLFAKPVPECVEKYRQIVLDPIDFSTIRTKALEGKYTTFGAFIADVRRLCKNALSYNPPGSIYAQTASELLKALGAMQKQASLLMVATRNTYSRFTRRSKQSFSAKDGKVSTVSQSSSGEDDAFHDLRNVWPAAVEMIENGHWLRSTIESDFVRTKENENAYYGALAIRRAAKAAETSIVGSTHTESIHVPCIRRGALRDEHLRNHIDKTTAEINEPSQLSTVPTDRELRIVHLLRCIQLYRMEKKLSSKSGCARCEIFNCNHTRTRTRWNIDRKQVTANHRIDHSRMMLNASLASERTKQSCKERREDIVGLTENSKRLLYVKESNIHGWGLFADEPFKKGDIVVEYLGEWIGNSVADARERKYKKRRIQDYQFRVSSNLVVDATLKGGCARYINHSCEPNCAAVIIDSPTPLEGMKRVLFICQRDIEPTEEITYDYQFPLELDLDRRIPCTCNASACRGFLNWDLPENVYRTVSSRIMNA